MYKCDKRQACTPTTLSLSSQLRCFFIIMIAPYIVRKKAKYGTLDSRGLSGAWSVKFSPKEWVNGKGFLTRHNMNVHDERLCSRLTALWRYINFVLLLLLLLSLLLLFLGKTPLCSYRSRKMLLNYYVIPEFLCRPIASVGRSGKVVFICADLWFPEFIRTVFTCRVTQNSKPLSRITTPLPLNEPDPI